jgi:WD40 repeat protein
MLVVEVQEMLTGKSLFSDTVELTHDRPVKGVLDFSRNGTCLIAAGFDRFIRVWELPE